MRTARNNFPSPVRRVTLVSSIYLRNSNSSDFYARRAMQLPNGILKHSRTHFGNEIIPVQLIIIVLILCGVAAVNQRDVRAASRRNITQMNPARRSKQASVSQTRARTPLH